MRAVLRAGADKVVVNTAAVLRPELLRECAQAFGRQCVVLAIDARSAGDASWSVFTHGGRVDAELDAVAWAAQGAALGAGELLVTSMDRDGTTAGYDIDLLLAIRDVIDVPLIASGGAGNASDMAVALSIGRADAVLAASIFHFETTTVEAIKESLATAGIPIRERSMVTWP